ncbi:AAA family ATPase [Psychrobacillus sp. NPDC093200]|uniref:AAA family ATPase n=1 Tax=Psychrobacillus sp. NPDC093200 TaxID=3390656 RepID=UPI003D04AE6C
MNKDLYKRLFKGIYSEDVTALKKLADIIISNEYKKNHVLLAETLEKIKQTEKPKVEKQFSKHVVNKNFGNEMSGLPISKRDNSQLVTYIPREKLKHHMVLNDEIETKLQSIEKEYVARHRLALFNLIPKKKILLYGSPGCGKTLAAERLAWNLGLPLLKVRFDTLLSSYFGESASNLRSIFEYCNNNAVVLLLDECDFIAKSRKNGQDVGEVPRIVNMLLTLLDEYESPGLLIATTNLKVALDEALFRRFDDIIELPKPSKKEIKRLILETLSAMKISKEIDFDIISKELEGHSSANIVSIAQQIAKNAVLEDSNIIKKDHVSNVINGITMKY